MKPSLARFRDPELGRRILEDVQVLAGRAADALGRKVRFMEVCGTHTVAISQLGLRGLLGDKVELLSGPGCPVCVTDQADIDLVVELARLPGVTVATFGDLLRVPGTSSSLDKERSSGKSIKVCYSPWEAVELAVAIPERRVIFVGIGFETTAPAVAVSLNEAIRRGISNFYLLSLHKLVPPVMQALASDPDLKIDGFLLPGHVSTIIGRREFELALEGAGKPSVIAGFEPVDILVALKLLLEQLVSGTASVVNGYPRAVREEGNTQAKKIMSEFFVPADASWRGLGMVPRSGLKLRPQYISRDAASVFEVRIPPAVPRRGCRCGEVLSGRITPRACALFGLVCTPESPAGPCMVSSEGACAAYYRYEADGGSSTV